LGRSPLGLSCVIGTMVLDQQFRRVENTEFIDHAGSTFSTGLARWGSSFFGLFTSMLTGNAAMASAGRAAVAPTETSAR
jgi:hypothetical protein